MQAKNLVSGVNSKALNDMRLIFWDFFRGDTFCSLVVDILLAVLVLKSISKNFLFNLAKDHSHLKRERKHRYFYVKCRLKSNYNQAHLIFIKHITWGCDGFLDYSL